jgi:hypothetical protein
MTKTLTRKTFALASFLGALLLSYAWLNPTRNLQSDYSIAAESVKVPAPKQGEKKVVLRDLGMA